MKGNKSFLKRIKVTKTGKMLHRPIGQCHFNSKESSEKTMEKRGLKKTSFSSRIKRRFLPKVSNK